MVLNNHTYSSFWACPPTHILEGVQVWIIGGWDLHPLCWDPEELADRFFEYTDPSVDQCDGPPAVDLCAGPPAVDSCTGPLAVDR